MERFHIEEEINAFNAFSPSNVKTKSSLWKRTLHMPAYVTWPHESFFLLYCVVLAYSRFFVISLIYQILLFYLKSTHICQPKILIFTFSVIRLKLICPHSLIGNLRWRLRASSPSMEMVLNHPGIVQCTHASQSIRTLGVNVPGHGLHKVSALLMSSHAYNSR